MEKVAADGILLRMKDHEGQPLSAIAAGLRDGSLHARELAQRALDSRRLGAFREVDEPRTLQQASGADASLAAGDDRGPLQGVPISIKDLFGVPGYQTFAGSPAPLPERFEKPGGVVREVLAQGAVVMGKTHTVEFAFGGVGTNPHHRTPINPWDPAAHRAPGGSTAGAGVSLCEGSSLLGLGSDTAGSVRIPASWTGNAGLKTTRGRWPTDGVVPLSTTLDTVGILARTVDDLVFAFRALDPQHGDAPIASAALSDLRLGRCDTLFFEDCSPGVVEAIDRALDELTAAGAQLRAIDLPQVLPAYELFCQGGPVSLELHRFLTSELPSWLETVDPNVRQRIGEAGGLPEQEYQARLATLRRLSASVDASLRSVDVLVSPCVANTPPRLDEIEATADYRRENIRCLRNTSIANYLGLCACTLPVGLDAAGMPVGLQLVARAMHEPALLAAALAFEHELGTASERFGRPPP